MLFNHNVFPKFIVISIHSPRTGRDPALKQAAAEAKGSQSSQPAQSKTSAKSNIDSLTKKDRKKAHEMSNAITSG